MGWRAIRSQRPTSTASPAKPVLTEAVSNFPVSSPHRGMLLSGMYPERNGVVLNCMSERPEVRCARTPVYRRRLLGGGLRLRLYRQAARRLPDEEQPPASGTYVSDAVPGGTPTRRPNAATGSATGTPTAPTTCTSIHITGIPTATVTMSTSGRRGTKFPAIEYIENKGGVRDPEKPFLMMIGMNPPHSLR